MGKLLQTRLEFHQVSLKRGRQVLGVITAPISSAILSSLGALGPGPCGGPLKLYGSLAMTLRDQAHIFILVDNI